MTDANAEPVFESLPGYREYPPGEMEARSRAFAAEMQRRRTTPFPLPRRKPLRETVTFR
jgi:hypothetical protein